MDILFPIAFFGIFGAAIVGLTLKTLKRRKRLAMNFDWYKAKHPACYKGNRISCSACGCNRIQVRNLMNGWYLREHICNQCGTTLYYSPESA